MQPIFSHSKKSLGLMTACMLLTACSSFLGLDEDDDAGQFAVVKLPPRISEQAGKKTPAVVPAVSLNTNEPAVPINSPAPAAAKTATVDLNQTTPAASQAKTTPVTPPKPLSLQADDASAAAGPMLFAPYIPTLREGEIPRRWQKEPTYDFPWIPGSTPTRINEETVVGFGEQMLGRLYARAVFSDKPGPLPVISEAVQVKPLPEPAKKGSKNARKPEPAPPAPAPAPAPVVTKRMIQCDGGATCLDVARDELVEDAKAKGWEMLLSRRVSLHNSFQFKRGQRVVWIELNSNGKRDLDIEYTLLPVQNKVQRN